MTDLFRFALAALTCFRLAQLVSLDSGPFLLFEWFREWVKLEAARRGGPFWLSLKEGVSCPYCTGFYAGLICVALVIWPTFWGDLFLLWFGIIGLQSFLQGVSRR